ncbi:hypothetical protein D3C87_1625260 [compost metagenome]
MLELGLAGREQFLADLHVRVHRAADVEQQQQLHRVAPFRAHLNIQQTGVLGGVVDGAVNIQLFRRALTSEFAQSAQGDFDVARAQFHRIIEVLVLALIPDFHGFALALASIADPNAFRVEATGAERASAASANPFVAAGVAFLLFFQTLLELFDQFVEAAEGLDLRAFFVA